jgi:hypothetical protein
MHKKWLTMHEIKKNKVLLFQKLKQHHSTTKKKVDTKLGCYSCSSDTDWSKPKNTYKMV